MAGQPIAPQDPETKREKAAMRTSRPSSLTSPYAMGYTTGASFNSRSEGFGSGSSGRGTVSPFRGARRSPIEAPSPTAHRQTAAVSSRGSTSHRPSWTPLSDRRPADAVISLESDDEIEIVDESETVKRKRRHDLVDPLRLMPDPRQELSPRKRQHTNSRSEAQPKKTPSGVSSKPRKTMSGNTSRNSYSQENTYPVDCFCIGAGEYYPSKDIDRQHFIVINRSHVKLIREIVPDALSDECTVHLSDCEGYRHYTCASQGKEASRLLALYVKSKTSSAANLLNFAGITEDSREFVKIKQENKIMLLTAVKDLKALKEFNNTLTQRPGKMQLRREEVSHPGELVDLGAYQESLRSAREEFKNKKIGHSSGMKRPNESVDANAIGSRKEGRKNSISHFFTKEEKQGFVEQNNTGPTPITLSRTPRLSKRDQGEAMDGTSGQSKGNTFEESGLEIQSEGNMEALKNKDTGTESQEPPQKYGRLVRGRRTSRRKAAAPPEEITVQEQVKTGVINFDNDPIPRETVVIVYPWGEDARGHSSIQVTHGDRRRLDEGEFLNDTLVEYGLKQLSIELEKRDPALASSVYVFNPYFFQNLSQKSKQPAEGQTLDIADDEPPFDSYNLVRKWTSKVDIFSKKYIIVPINENFHWYLAIIVNPGGILESQRDLMNRIHGARTSERSLPKARLRSESKRESKGNKEAGITADDVTGAIAPDTAHIELAGETSITALSTTTRNAETPQSTAVSGSAVNDTSQDDATANPTVAIGSGTNTIAISGTAENITVSEPAPNLDSPGDSASSVSGALNDLSLGDASSLHTERSYATLSEGVSNSEPTASRDLSSASTDRPQTNYDPERCYVLIFDSLGSAHQAAAKRLKDYLKREAADKLNIHETSDQKCTAKLVETPLQPNFCDCGLYVLHYSETFFEDPVEMLNFVMRKKPSGRKLTAFRSEIDDRWRAEIASVRRRTMREELKRLAVEYEEYNRPFAAREEARALRKKRRAERAKDASRVSKVEGKTNEDPDCVILDDSDDSDSVASSEHEAEAEDTVRGAEIEANDPGREAEAVAEDAVQVTEAGAENPTREAPSGSATDTAPAVLESPEESTTRDSSGNEAEGATTTSLSSDGDRILANAGEPSMSPEKADTSGTAHANDLRTPPPAVSSVAPLTIEPVSYDTLLQTFDKALSSTPETLSSPHSKSGSSDMRRSQSTPQICIPVTHFLSASESPKEEEYYSISEAPTLTLDAQESEPMESDTDTVQF